MDARQKCSDELRENASKSMLSADFATSGQIVTRHLVDIAIECCATEKTAIDSIFIMIPYYSGSGIAFQSVTDMAYLNQAILEVSATLTAKMEIPAAMCIGILSEAVKIPKDQAGSIDLSSDFDIATAKSGAPKLMTCHVAAMAVSSLEDSGFAAIVTKEGSKEIHPDNVDYSETWSLTPDSIEDLSQFKGILPHLLNMAERFTAFYKKLIADEEVMIIATNEVARGQ